jgi:hypothetical protein
MNLKSLNHFLSYINFNIAFQVHKDLNFFKFEAKEYNFSSPKTDSLTYIKLYYIQYHRNANL